jgi:hypothetical protein
LLFLIVLLPFFSQQNSPFVTSSFSGSGHYVFNIKGQPTIYLWIGKTDFLIHQIKTFGKNAAGKEFTFIETHENIATNQPFTEDDFLEQAQ